MNNEMLAKIYVVEINIVIRFQVLRVAEEKGGGI